MAKLMQIANLVSMVLVLICLLTGDQDMTTRWMLWALLFAVGVVDCKLDEMRRTKP